MVCSGKLKCFQKIRLVTQLFFTFGQVEGDAIIFQLAFHLNDVIFYLLKQKGLWQKLTISSIKIGKLPCFEFLWYRMHEPACSKLPCFKFPLYIMHEPACTAKALPIQVLIKWYLHRLSCSTYVSITCNGTIKNVENFQFELRL